MTPANRRRVMDGLAAAIEDKGFAATTIADIVRRAELSKRTFYEEFSDKDECFLALYREVSGVVITALRQSFSPESSWSDRAHAVVKTYLKSLRKRPALTRAFFLELNAAGPRAISARREVLDDFAAFVCDLVAESRGPRQALRVLSPPMALALVAGINELVLLTIERHRLVRLEDVEFTALELLLGMTSV